MRNLHRIMGAKFKHFKPGQCDDCPLRHDYGEWRGRCTADGKILSEPNSNKSGRCKDKP